jgi:hypothetical protein
MSFDSRQYIPVGSPGDVQNINPYSDDFWNNILNGGNGYNSLLSTMSGLSDQLMGLYQQAQNMDISATGGWENFMSQVPELQRLAQKAITPYSTYAGTYADLASNQARKAVEAQYANRGNIYTGGFGSAVSEAMSAPYYEAAANTQALQSQLLGSLYGTGMQTAQTGYSSSIASQLQALGLGADILGTQYATTANQANAMLGAMGQYAQPEWWQPTYVANQNYWANWLPELAGGLLGGVVGLSTTPFSSFEGSLLGKLLGLGQKSTSAYGSPYTGSVYDTLKSMYPEPQWPYGT